MVPFAWRSSTFVSSRKLFRPRGREIAFTRVKPSVAEPLASVRQFILAQR